MTLYKEFMRRLFRVGITLLILSAVAALIYSIMDCVGVAPVYVTSPIQMTPTLAFYAYIGGAGLAFAGFSFLNRRTESDFYHSIPVRRTNLYISVTAAAATWMLITIALCVAVSTAVHLATRTPFAPAYPFMNIAFFFAAALLVFAAAAIGCTITGTWFTNLILTCLVLFLPRYILFMIGRTIVADTEVISWLDLRGLLDPRTNAATGLIVMLSRSMLQGSIVSLGSILWSLALALAELAAGAMLFRRRPSELAEQGAGSRVLQTLFACLLALPLLLLLMLRADAAGTIFICIIAAASLACYVIYQVIVLKNAKRVLLSLPWNLCTVFAGAAILFGA
ncbi:MAG: hypothetical protein Q4C13_03725, partial [Clostridia bacterium]|nr:hypothetical protein [Clostridia bacterium]